VTATWNRFNVESTDSFDVAEARRLANVSETGANLHGRRATIYKASQSAMTSGTAGSKWWAIRLNRSDKWTSHLMGWMASTDTAQQIEGQARFESPEQAILYCERNGIEYELETPPVEYGKGGVDNQYAYNFLPMEVQARMKSAGVRKARKIFENPDSPSNAGVSTFVNYRYTQRGNEHWKPRTDGTYVKGVAQGPTAWTGEAWPAAQPKNGGGH
jgi:hypothetical protein